MSYLQQQQKVQAEKEDIERQKVEDELELHNEETRKASEADSLNCMNEAQQNSSNEERNLNNTDSTITVKERVNRQASVK